MNNYSPFERPLRDLSANDLFALTSVREGWYVEYKSQVINASSIAKCISAFANTHGGWLFFGIKEKSKDDAVAGSFVGISCADVDSFQQTIRQAVATLVSPVPHFELLVLRGPCLEIGLEDERAVICLQIPRSLNTPHVHKSGQIYRRVADGSEPKPENDRFVLDQLWRRADDFKKNYRKWVKRDPELSKDESKQPFLRLLIVPDLWAGHDIRFNFDVDHVRGLINASEVNGINVPFETVYTSAKGIVARQKTLEGPHNAGLIWKLWSDLSSDVLLPISKFEITNLKMIPYELHGYEQASRLVQILEEQHYSSASILDLNFLFYLLLGVVKIQQRLCSDAAWSGSWFIKARLMNVWRTTPFLDVSAALDRYEKHGVPMCLEGNVTVPPGYDPETFSEILTFGEIDLEEARNVVRAQLIFSIVANAFGIPPTLIPFKEDSERTLFSELSEAGNRAIEAQKIRNARKSTRNLNDRRI